MPGLASVKPAEETDIKTRAHSSPRAFGVSPLLEGDFGKTRGPAVVSFVADDFDNGDVVYGIGGPACSHSPASHRPTRPPTAPEARLLARCCPLRA